MSSLETRRDRRGQSTTRPGRSVHPEAASSLRSQTRATSTRRDAHTNTRQQRVRSDLRKRTQNAQLGQDFNSPFRRTSRQLSTQAQPPKRKTIRQKQKTKDPNGFELISQSQYTHTWRDKSKDHNYRFKLDGLQPQDLLAILAQPVVLGMLALALISVIAIPKLLPPNAEHDSDAPAIPSTGFYTDPKTKRIYYYENKQPAEGERTLDGEEFYFDPAASGALFTGFMPQSVQSDTSLREDKSSRAYAYYDPQDGHKVADQGHILGQIASLDKETGLISPEDYLHLLGESIPKSDDLASFNGYVMTSDQETELKTLIESFTTKKYKLGFVIQDLTTGQGISYGNTTPVYSASAIKAPYLASLLAGPLRSDEKRRQQYENDFEQILVSSDNKTYGQLQRDFGQEPFQSWTRDLRLHFPLKTGEYYTTTTARDLSLMWLKMYSQYQAGDIPENFTQMASHPETSALYKNLSSSAKTYSKAGWYPNDGSTPATNDAGIVVTSQGSYVISICSSAPEQFDMLSPLVNKLNEIYLKSIAPNKYAIAREPELKEN